MADVAYREQYVDAVSSVLSDQELAGLDILTNGDYHLDADIAGRSWFSYPSERFEGVSEYDTETTFGWSYPVGSWLNEIVGGWKYHAVTDKIGPRVPLEFAKIWRVAQARTERPVKFGTIAADLAATVLTVKTDAYAQDKQDLMWDIATILNAELRELQAAGATGDPDRGAGHPLGRRLRRVAPSTSTSSSTCSTTRSRGWTSASSGSTRAGGTPARSTASIPRSRTSPRSTST